MEGKDLLEYVNKVLACLLLQLEQGRIQRAVVDFEQIAARLLDTARDAIAMEGAQGLQRLEHHQSQRALPDVRLGVFHM